MVDASVWKPRKVEKDRLLLVEGKDEVRLVEAILKAMNVDSIQVFDGGGKDAMRGRLRLILGDAKVNHVDLKAVGVVRDADISAKDAFDSVRAALRDNHLPAPEAPLTSAGSAPSAAILILPDGSADGCLEDLCWKSIAHLAAGACVESYVGCLKSKHALESRLEAKTRVHAFLASRKDPTTTVGVGADKGYIPLDHPAFEVVRKLIRLVEMA
ncbi:MAG: hypothetical protein HYX92_15420 [Chloroflexi bacterium]|nr:hypothetical protein [Chloroflexota bacterium]